MRVFVPSPLIINLIRLLLSVKHFSVSCSDGVPLGGVGGGTNQNIYTTSIMKLVSSIIQELCDFGFSIFFFSL